MPDQQLVDLNNICKRVRLEILNMAYKSKTGHLGPAFSIVELLVILYFDRLNINPAEPLHPNRDFFILSKGHAAPSLYAVLAHRGFFDIKILNSYQSDGGALHGHISRNAVPGIEVSTGSLGHGLAIGAGIAHAYIKNNSKQKIFVLMGDGECNEGSIWETAMYASHNNLDNLVAIVDYNKFQGFGSSHEVMSIHPLIDKWLSFGWAVYEIDGHNLDEIKKTYQSIPKENLKPTVIIAHTIAGQGMSHISNTLDAHYFKPDEDIYKKTLTELNAQ